MCQFGQLRVLFRFSKCRLRSSIVQVCLLLCGLINESPLVGTASLIETNCFRVSQYEHVCVDVFTRILVRATGGD